MKKKITQTAILATTLGAGFSVTHIQANEIASNSEDSTVTTTQMLPSNDTTTLEAEIQNQTKVVESIESQIEQLSSESAELTQQTVENAKKEAELASEKVTQATNELSNYESSKPTLTDLEKQLKETPQTIENLATEKQQATDWEYYFNLLKNGTQAGVSAEEYLNNVFIGAETDQYKTIENNASQYNLPVKWGGAIGASGTAGALQEAVNKGIDNIPQETIKYSEDTTNVGPVTTIKLSDLGATMSDFKAGTYKYVPNPDKVSEYYVYYLNGLRRLNGINAPLKADTRVTKLVQDNVEFFTDLQRRNVPGYTSAYTDTKVSEIYDQNGNRVGSRPVNAPSPENGLLYLTRGESSMLSKSNHAFVYSDQELAYHILLSEFSEYRNNARFNETGTIYGEKGYPTGAQKDALWRHRETYYHRLVALFADTDFAGVGVAYDKEGNLRTNTIFMSENTEDFKLFEQETHYNWPGNPSAVPHVPTGTDARLPGNGTSNITIDRATGNMLYKGKRLEFLPKTVFEYVEETITSSDNPDYIALREDLVAKEQEIANYNDKVNMLIEDSIKKSENYQLLKLNFDTYSKLKADLQAILEKETAELEALKDTLSKLKPITSTGEEKLNYEVPTALIQTESIPFLTIYKEDPTLALGEEIVVQVGKDGEKQIITILDQVTEVVTVEKFDKIVNRGTLLKPEPQPEPQPTENKGTIVGKKPTLKQGNSGNGGEAVSTADYTGQRVSTLPKTGATQSTLTVLGLGLLTSALYLIKRRKL